MRISLPLMGIENPTVASMISALPCGCSLPLMGIENTGYCRWCGLDHSDSLPLMGIENCPLSSVLLGR